MQLKDLVIVIERIPQHHEKVPVSPMADIMKPVRIQDIQPKSPIIYIERYDNRACHQSMENQKTLSCQSFNMSQNNSRFRRNSFLKSAANRHEVTSVSSADVNGISSDVNKRGKLCTTSGASTCEIYEVNNIDDSGDDIYEDILDSTASSVGSESINCVEIEKENVEYTGFCLDVSRNLERSISREQELLGRVSQVVINDEVCLEKSSGTNNNCEIVEDDSLNVIESFNDIETIDIDSPDNNEGRQDMNLNDENFADELRSSVSNVADDISTISSESDEKTREEIVDLVEQDCFEPASTENNLEGLHSLVSEIMEDISIVSSEAEEEVSEIPKQVIVDLEEDCFEKESTGKISSDRSVCSSENVEHEIVDVDACSNEPDRTWKTFDTTEKSKASPIIEGFVEKTANEIVSITNVEKNVIHDNVKNPPLINCSPPEPDLASRVKKRRTVKDGPSSNMGMSAKHDRLEKDTNVNSNPTRSKSDIDIDFDVSFLKRTTRNKGVPKIKPANSVSVGVPRRNLAKKQSNAKPVNRTDRNKNAECSNLNKMINLAEIKRELEENPINLFEENSEPFGFGPNDINIFENDAGVTNDNVVLPDMRGKLLDRIDIEQLKLHYNIRALKVVITDIYRTKAKLNCDMDGKSSKSNDNKISSCDVVENMKKKRDINHGNDSDNVKTAERDVSGEYDGIDQSSQEISNLNMISSEVDENKRTKKEKRSIVSVHDSACDDKGDDVDREVRVNDGKHHDKDVSCTHPKDVYGDQSSRSNEVEKNSHKHHHKGKDDNEDDVPLKVLKSKKVESKVKTKSHSKADDIPKPSEVGTPTEVSESFEELVARKLAERNKRLGITTPTLSRGESSTPKSSKKSASSTPRSSNNQNTSSSSRKSVEKDKSKIPVEKDNSKISVEKDTSKISVEKDKKKISVGPTLVKKDPPKNNNNKNNDNNVNKGSHTVNKSSTRTRSENVGTIINNKDVMETNQAKSLTGDKRENTTRNKPSMDLDIIQINDKGKRLGLNLRNSSRTTTTTTTTTTATATNSKRVAVAHRNKRQGATVITSKISDTGNSVAQSTTLSPLEFMHPSKRMTLLSQKAKEKANTNVLTNPVSSTPSTSEKSVPHHPSLRLSSAFRSKPCTAANVQNKQNKSQPSIQEASPSTSRRNNVTIIAPVKPKPLSRQNRSRGMLLLSPQSAKSRRPWVDNSVLDTSIDSECDVIGISDTESESSSGSALVMTQVFHISSDDDSENGSIDVNEPVSNQQLVHVQNQPIETTLSGSILLNSSDFLQQNHIAASPTTSNASVSINSSTDTPEDNFECFIIPSDDEDESISLAEMRKRRKTSSKTKGEPYKAKSIEIEPITEKDTLSFNLPEIQPILRKGIEQAKTSIKSKIAKMDTVSRTKPLIRSITRRQLQKLSKHFKLARLEIKAIKLSEKDVKRLIKVCTEKHNWNAKDNLRQAGLSKYDIERLGLKSLRIQSKSSRYTFRQFLKKRQRYDTDDVDAESRKIKELRRKQKLAEKQRADILSIRRTLLKINAKFLNQNRFWNFLDQKVDR